MTETIAAISTAQGEGGIGIVRISGDKAREILKKVFIAATGENFENSGRRLVYGKVVDAEKGETVDEALAVCMKAPKTYTGEDVCEINCHGGIVSLRKTLSLVLSCGARLAEPGEFTKRAFLNGRLDLSQAEAIIDLIKAKTDKTFDVAIGQLEGRLSREIRAIRKELMDILVQVTVNIDYPDEDIEEVVYETLENHIAQIGDKLGVLMDTSLTGRIMREGLSLVIIGKPNVGKSSLMNAVLNENRAIVTDIPGTTRDTIEETVSIRGIPVNIIDTAGIRETSNPVEKIGVEKTKESFNKADLVILILDVSQELTREDEEIIEYVREKNAFVLANKIDLGRQITVERIAQMLPNAKIIEASIPNYVGTEALKDAIEEEVYGGKVRRDQNVLITNIRQEELLKGAAKSLADAREMIKNGEALDFVEVDINRCYELLGEIIGETVSGDIIEEVFSRFCLGK